EGDIDSRKSHRIKFSPASSAVQRWRSSCVTKVASEPAPGGCRGGTCPRCRGYRCCGSCRDCRCCRAFGVDDVFPGGMVVLGVLRHKLLHEVGRLGTDAHELFGLVTAGELASCGPDESAQEFPVCHQLKGFRHIAYAHDDSAVRCQKLGFRSWR